MKKLTRRSFTAAGILSALGLGVFSVSGNLIGCVYGPPPEEYDPDQNEIEDVYGPPPVDDEDDDDDAGEVDENDDDEDYDPEENIPVAVYGPPGGW